MRRVSAGRLGEKLAPYVLLAPFLFTLIVFFGYAFVRVVYFSFTNYDLFSKPEWVGLRNYLNIFRDPEFTRAMKNSLTFMVVVTAAQTMIALLLALFLNRKMRGIKFFRAAYYMPSVASSVVVTLIFIWFFQRRGVLNYVICRSGKAGDFGAVCPFSCSSTVVWCLGEAARRLWLFLNKASCCSPCRVFISFWPCTWFHPAREVAPVDIIWFNTTKTWPDFFGALAFPIPLGAIMLFNIWTTAPTFMLLYLAGLQDIPGELYEAAAVDGAEGWHMFWKITVPQLKPITFLVVTMGLIGTLQMFDQVAILGSQAPRSSTITLAYYIYTNLFPSSASPRVGMASAAAMFLALLTLVIVYAQRKVLGGENDA